MEKQSTSRLLKLLAAVFAMFLLMMGGLFLVGCGEDDTANVEPDHTHTYTKDNSKSLAATCGAIGYDVYTCACGYTYGEMTAATGKHDYADGNYCKTCGVSKDNAADVLAKLNSFVDGYKQVDLTGIESKLNGLASAEKLESVLTKLNSVASADALSGIETKLDEVSDNAAVLEAIAGVKSALEDLDIPATKDDLDGIEDLVDEIKTKLAALNNVATKDDLDVLDDILEDLGALDSLTDINGKLASISSKLETLADEVATKVATNIESLLSDLAKKTDLEDLLEGLLTADDLADLATKEDLKDLATTEQLNPIIEALERLEGLELDEKIDALSKLMKDVPGKIDNLADTVAKIETAVGEIKAETAQIKNLVTSAAFDEAVAGIESSIKAAKDEIMAFLRDKENFHVNHGWNKSISIKETCTSIGLEIEQCGTCGSTRVVKSTPALGGKHKYTEANKIDYLDATCQHLAYFIYECSICHAPIQVKDETVKELAEHHYVDSKTEDGKLIYTEDATEFDPGRVQTECEWCGKKSSRPGDKTTDHTHDFQEATKENLKKLIDALTGRTTTKQETIEAAKKLIPVYAATCEENGLSYSVCVSCGAIKYTYKAEAEEEVAPVAAEEDEDNIVLITEHKGDIDKERATVPMTDHNFETKRIRYVVDETKFNGKVVAKAVNTIEWNSAVCKNSCGQELLLDKDGKIVCRLEKAINVTVEEFISHFDADAGMTTIKSEYKTYFTTSYHAWAETEYVIPATCTEDGIFWYQCNDTNCQGEHTDGAPECWEDENHNVICYGDVDGRWISIILPAKGHKWQDPQVEGETSNKSKVEPPTCTKPGKITIVCDNDNSHIIEITLTGDYGKWGPDVWAGECPADFEDAYELVCTWVKDNDADKNEPAEVTDLPEDIMNRLLPTGHIWEIANETKDTCTTAPSTKWRCRTCNEEHFEQKGFAEHKGKKTTTFYTYELVNNHYCAVEKGTYIVTWEAEYCTKCGMVLSVEEQGRDLARKFRHFPFDRDALDKIMEELKDGKANMDVLEEFVAAWNGIHEWYTGTAGAYFAFDVYDYLVKHNDVGSNGDGYVVVCFDCFETLYQITSEGWEAMNETALREYLEGKEDIELRGDITITGKTINFQAGLLDGRGHTITADATLTDGNPSLAINNDAIIKNVTFEKGTGTNWQTIGVHGKGVVVFENVTFEDNTVIYVCNFSGTIKFENCTFNNSNVQFEMYETHKDAFTFVATNNKANVKDILFDFVLNEEQSKVSITFTDNVFTNVSENPTAAAIRFKDGTNNKWIKEELCEYLNTNTFLKGAQIVVREDGKDKTDKSLAAEMIESGELTELPTDIVVESTLKFENVESFDGNGHTITDEGKSGSGISFKVNEEHKDMTISNVDIESSFHTGGANWYTVSLSGKVNDATITFKNVTFGAYTVIYGGDGQFTGTVIFEDCTFEGHKGHNQLQLDAATKVVITNCNIVARGSVTIDIIHSQYAAPAQFEIKNNVILNQSASATAVAVSFKCNKTGCNGECASWNAESEEFKKLLSENGVLFGAQITVKDTPVSAVTENGNVVLPKNSEFTVDSTIEAKGEFTLDGNNSTFESNRPAGDGNSAAALRIQGNATIKNLTFEKGEKGGWCLVSIENGGTITFENCTFVGGAVYAYGSTANVTFKNCIFRDGGYFGMEESAMDVTFDGCTINGTANVLQLWYKAEAKVTIKDCTFNGSNVDKCLIEVGGDGWNSGNFELCGECTWNNTMKPEIAEEAAEEAAAE